MLSKMTFKKQMTSDWINQMSITTSNMLKKKKKKELQTLVPEKVAVVQGTKA